ncbi:urea transporter [Edwardsiella ictaluri]|uniref:urea transporter n=1 Tax=Edwardsiella ictaluri TaxID=67780 RepID=UPI001E32420A|nr:urea transporter [Edwardsiella ictaluri]
MNISKSGNYTNLCTGSFDAYLNNTPVIAWGCLLVTAVATLTGYLIIRDRTSLRSGLCGYNGCLVGAALPVFLVPTPTLWCVLILSSALSVIVATSISECLKGLKIAALTGPFVVTTWVVLLASYNFPQLVHMGLPATFLPQQHTHLLTHSYYHTEWLGAFNGVSEVFLFSNIVSGMLMCIGLACGSLWNVFYAVFSAVLSMLIALWLGGTLQGVDAGMFSFSAVLTGIALGATFSKPGMMSFCYTVIGVFFVVLMQGALNTALAPLGIPSLTMPFVLATWVLLLVHDKTVLQD